MMSPDVLSGEILDNEESSLEISSDSMNEESYGEQSDSNRQKRKAGIGIDELKDSEEVGKREQKSMGSFEENDEEV